MSPPTPVLPPVTSGAASTPPSADALQDGFVDIHVRIDVLHVVVVLESVYQLDRALRLLADQLDDVLRNHRHLGRVWVGQTGLFQAVADGLEFFGLGHHHQRLTLGANVVCTQLDRQLGDLVLVDDRLLEHDEALLFEHPADRSGGARLPPCRVITLRMSLAVRLRLSVMISTSTAAPPGPNTS